MNTDFYFLRALDLFLLRRFRQGYSAIFFSLSAIFFSLTSVFALSTSEWAASDLIVSENRHFQIVGRDAPSVAYISQLSSFIAESVLVELADPRYDNSRTVLVQLNEVSPGGTQAYSVQISQLGFVTLSIYWQDKLDLYSTIEGLVCGFIQAYGYASYGALYSVPVPANAWIIQALASNAYVQLRPKMARSFYLEAEGAPFNFLLFEGRFGNSLESHPMAAQSFALYRWMKKQSLSAGNKQKIIRSALQGIGSLENLLGHCSVESKTAFLEIWKAFLQQEQAKYRGQFFDLNRSKVWLESLASFSEISFETDTQFEDLRVQSLWSQRESPEFRRTLEARIELITMALSRINPLYYNAAQSLALSYQTLLDAEYKWELLYYFADYLQAMDRAQELHAQITEALEAPVRSPIRP